MSNMHSLCKIATKGTYSWIREVRLSNARLGSMCGRISLSTKITKQYSI